MRLLIDKKDLELLLEKKREFIGNKVAIDTIIAGVSFLLSVFTASYDDILGIPGIVLKTIFCMIGILYCMKIAKDIFHMYKDKYDYNDLMKDITGLDMIQHNHSLVVIRNLFTENKQKFLVYYDEKWDCKLFLNYKTMDRDNENSILDRVAADLALNREDMECHYITSRVQEKYSVSHGENRVYNHRLYELKIHHFPEQKNDLNMMKNKIINCNKLELECFQDVSKIDMNKNYDAVFIDIDMPMMNGIDFANQYKLKHLDTFIIFVTNHSELVFDTFKVHPFDFIRKEHFDLEIERVIEELMFLLDKKNKKIQVKSNGEIIQIKLVDILFCESNKHNCYIYKNNNTCIKVRMKLSEIYKLLDSDIFFQVNKSFLINWNCVEKISNGMIIYENGLCFNISRSMIKEAKRLFLVRKAENV